MKFTGRHFLIAALAIGAALGAYSRNHRFDLNEHKQFDVLVDRLLKVDVTLNENLLKSRFHLVSDYDSLETPLAELKHTAAEITTMPAFISTVDRATFQQQLRAFSDSLDEKAELIEDFKSESALLNNSLRYLPGGSRELVARLITNDQGQLIEAPINRLTQRVLAQGLQTSDEVQLSIQQDLDRIADWCARHREHPEVTAVSQIAAHAKSIVSRKPKVEELTERIVALPTNFEAEELGRIYERSVTAALRRSDIVRWGLEGACLVLLLGVGYFIYALNQLNGSLESRVVERTRELSAEIAQRERVEEALVQSEHFLQCTLDALSAHIAMLDAEGTIVAVNETWKKFAASNGAADGSFGIGTNYLQVSDRATGRCSDQALAVSTGIRRVMSGKESEFQLEYPCHSETEERWFLMRVTRFNCEGASYMVVAHENVTARATAERDLRTQEAELRILFDFLPAMICLKDTANRILRANQRLADSLGKDIRDIEGKLCSEVYPAEGEKFFVDDLEVIHSGQPKLGIVESFRNAEGREFWIETDKAPVLDKDGNVIGLIAMAQDMTERRRAEEDLRWKTALLEAQMEASLDGILVINEQGRKLLQNKQTVELLQIPPHLAAQEDDGEQLRWVTESTKDPTAFLDRVSYLNAHREEIGRDEVHLKNGTVLDRYSSPVTGRDGKYYGRIWTFRDITERKRSEAELQDVHTRLVEASHQAGMAEVATGVLHNVGNVLNSVNISSSLLGDFIRKSKVGNLNRVVTLLDDHAADLGTFISQNPQGRNLPTYLRRLHERLCQEQQDFLTELDALQGNVEHIKDIVAMQQNYASFAGVTEVLQLGDLVDDALRMNSSSLHRHDVQVIKQYEKVPPVTVDKHKILQILVNLVRNAKQACDESGKTEKRLTFSVTNVPNFARVSVSDNGIGISPENLTRIFAHGFTTKKNGHGFGLHSSALAAKEMGGSLRVHSEGVGRGATFTVELPLSQSTTPGITSTSPVMLCRS